MSLERRGCKVEGCKSPAKRRRTICSVHIVWGSQGGLYSKGNVAVVCPNCHRLIHTKRLNIG